MDVIVVLQARMGSSRLPGKAMFPLDGVPAIVHEIRRASALDRFDRSDVVVATSEKERDDVLAFIADRAGATVYRGSEVDVLGRIANAVDVAGVDGAIRVCGDNTLIDPRLMEVLVDRLSVTGADYVSTKFEHTFPIGHNADAFTRETVSRAAKDASDEYHREHVAQYFKDERERFDWKNVTADHVFHGDLIDDVPRFPELRLTMDEAEDYRLLSQVYEEVPYDYVLDTPRAIRYIVDNDLRTVNDDVPQEVW